MGLTQNALLAWAGTHRLSALARIAPALATRPITPASAVLALFVAGADIPLPRLRGLPLEALVALGLLEIPPRDATAGAPIEPDAHGPLERDHVRARVAILPLEQTLVVCDRFDASSARELVLYPDDSSYHLASAIPGGRRERWIDLATGSAFAPLARPSLAAQITGIDLNPRAVELARLGAALSGCAHVTMRCADIGVALGAEPTLDTRTQLVTCNAPILGDPDVAIWRATDRAFFERLWRTARACVAPGGEVIVHCVLDGVPGTHELDGMRNESEVAGALDGDVTIVVYTPQGERAYCVVWWSPDARARRTLHRRALTPARPHLDARDRDEARST
ncbi:MAG: hypothetical protein ACKV2T_01495 [Kofleriaceae bacterium]